MNNRQWKIIKRFLLIIDIILVLTVLAVIGFGECLKNFDTAELIALNNQPVFEKPPVFKKQIILQANAVSTAVFGASGDEIASLNPNKKWPIASITKLMTIIIAKKEMPLTEKIKVGEKTANNTAGEETGILFTGEYAVEDIIKAMVLISSNDAALAVADYYGRDKFIKEMNDMAQKLGMNDTTFRDPAGLSPENLSTVEDLGKLVEFIRKNNPEIFEISKKTSDTVFDFASGTEKKLNNINVFAGREDFLGGKTGRIPKSGGNLISIFNFNGPKIIIVLGTDDRFGETEKILKQLYGIRGN